MWSAAATAESRVFERAAALSIARRLAPIGSVLVVLVAGAVAKIPETVLPIGSDTGMYATYARLILGGGRPYVDFYDIHPPLTYYFWALIESLTGSDWSRTCGAAWMPCVSLTAHAFDLALTYVTAILVYAIARQLRLRPLVGVLAAVFVVWFANESMISMEGSTPTKLTLVPGTLAIFAYLRYLDTARLRWAVFAGAAAILSALAKQPGLMTLVTVVAYADLAGTTRRRAIGGMAVGGLVVLVPVLIYLGAIGSLGGFIDQAWSYNAERFLIGYWQTPAGLASPATRIDRVFGQAAGLLFVGAAVGGLALLALPPRGHQRLLLAWGLFSLVAIAGFREFAQVVPALSLLAAFGIWRLWDAAAQNGLGLGHPIAGRVALLTVFGTIFVLSSGFELTEWRRAMFERGPTSAPADPEVIGAYLRQSAPPGPIFVWANAGQIYALSGRQPVSRFVIGEFANALQLRAAASRQQLMDDLQAHPPAVIVVDPHADEAGLSLREFPALSRLLDSCYTRVPQMPSAWGVFTRQSSGACP